MMLLEVSPAVGWGMVALGCLGLEVLQGVPFVFIFFAGAAGVTGIVTALHVTPMFWQQASFAAVLACLLFVGLRRYMLEWAKRTGTGRPGALGAPQGSAGLALDEARAGYRLRVELFGVAWQARNVGTKSIMKGARCRVVEVEGLCLNVVVDASSEHN